MSKRLRPERPFDKLRVVLSNLEGRGAKPPSESAWGARLRQGYGEVAPSRTCF